MVVIRQRVRLGLALVALVAPSAPPAAQSDLDDFMARVLARRDENWKKLQQYVLDEHEEFQVIGPAGTPIYGYRNDYAWFIREGYFIRSPLRVNGVTISEADRAKAESSYLERERAREKRSVEGDAPVDGRQSALPMPNTAPALGEDVLKGTLEPSFVRAAYFLKFKFDAGRYALAGRERLDDRDVLRIEYYPTRLFTEGRTRPHREVRKRDAQIEQRMNKNSLVTLWIDPAAHQILQYTFSNVDLDFLPARWFVQVDGLEASMRMSQPFPNVWLPATVALRFRVTLAIGPVDARYDMRYHDYRLADVTVKVR